MANEITVIAELAYADSEGANLDLAVNKVATISTKEYVYAKLNVAITDTVIGLGAVSSLGWALFINRDPVNFINIKTASSGTVIMKLFPGEAAMFRFGSGITAPAAIADTAPCQIEYIILNA